MNTSPPIALKPFLLRHALLIPGVLVLLALGAEHLGWDVTVSGFFFDPAQGIFPAHEWEWLELVGHRLAKSTMTLLWFVILATALLAKYWPRLATYRRALWSTLLGMSIGPVMVVMLKGLNSHHCPWDLKLYGGAADFSSNWFVAASEVGYCFPSGHGAAGFSVVALMFAGYFMGNPKLERTGLYLTVLLGVGFSAVRIAQGAHFLSHNLWSAAICWAGAAVSFAALHVRVEQNSGMRVQYEGSRVGLG